MDDTTPIGEACDALGLSAADRTAILSLVGVRTLGDLRVVLDRGEVEKGLEKKLRKVLGNA